MKRDYLKTKAIKDKTQITETAEWVGDSSVYIQTILIPNFIDRTDETINYATEND